MPSSNASGNGPLGPGKLFTPRLSDRMPQASRGFRKPQDGRTGEDGRSVDVVRGRKALRIEEEAPVLTTGAPECWLPTVDVFRTPGRGAPVPLEHLRSPS